MSDFDFDWTGEDPDFLVTNETQSISSVGSNEFHIVVPSLSPFFWDSIVVEHYNAGWNPLVKDIDYTPGHLFVQATRQTALAIYGSLVIANKSLTGAIRLTYQKLGGSWSIDIGHYNVILSDKVVNPRRTTWEQVAGYPEQFPPIPHVHIDEEDMTTMADVTLAINNLADVVSAFLGTSSETAVKQVIPYAVGDEETPIELGAKPGFRMPFGFTLQSIKASLTTPQTSGTVLTVDIKKNGTTLFTTPITFTNGEDTSLTAVVQSVLATTLLANDDKISFDITQIGDGTAVGLKVYFIGISL